MNLLQAHLLKTPKTASRQQNVHFQSENVELTSLLSVLALARKLLASTIPYLNTIILNAGIVSVVGLDWPAAIYYALTDPVHSLTWPTFKIAAVGLVTKPQLPNTNDQSVNPEPPLGEVFCANIFGHYLLTHWLMPLLHACPLEDAKIIWVSSVEPTVAHFYPDDLQGLTAPTPYEHTKRLADLLALTAQNHPSTSRSVTSFLDPTPSQTLFPQSPTYPARPQYSVPQHHLCQPGVCITTIVKIPAFMQHAQSLAICTSRLLGNPWTLIYPYNGALVLSWLALTPSSDIELAKADDSTNGPLNSNESEQTDHLHEVQELQGATGVKWGSAALSRFNFANNGVRKTEVDGWGLVGDGEPYGKTWWAGGWGRRRGAKEATSEDVREFVGLGARCWREMEVLRREWERRIVEWERERSRRKRLD